MRLIAIALIAALAGCAPASSPEGPVVPPPQAYGSTSPEALERVRAELSARGMGDEAYRAPEQRARVAREASLLEDALSGRPDYVQALRRAAEANISEENPVVRQSRAAREARIDAEVARLSDLIEVRRRERLAQRSQQDRAAQMNAARAACDAQASAVGAGTYTPYSRSGGVLGSALAGAINSSAAEEQARAGCYRAYGF